MKGYFGLGEITVYDVDGNLFYDAYFEVPTGFNLPSGVFTIEGNHVELDSLVSFKLPKLPKPERIIKIPNKIKLIEATNPNKATINPSKGLIVADPSILRSNRVTRAFVLLHELGHHYYVTESKADEFAIYHCIKLGFNPSQIREVAKRTLKNCDRSKKIIKKTSKKHIYV